MKQEEQINILLLHYVTSKTSVINKGTKTLSFHFKGKSKPNIIFETDFFRHNTMGGGDSEICASCYIPNLM